MNFNETSIPTNYAERMSGTYMLYVQPRFVENLFSYATKSVASALALVGSKNKIGYVVKDENKSFIMAAIYIYIPNTNAEMQGAYSLEFTFDEADLLDCDQIISIESEIAKREFKKHAWEGEKMEFHADHLVVATFTSVFKTLRAWLETNVGQTIEHVVFTAESAKEDDEIVLSVIPLGSLTQIVKKDAMDSVA